MLTKGSIVHDAYYWERVGFRAAWISVTQLPLLFLLAGKVNIIGFLIGSSHPQLNWLHRWVARTLLISVTVHGSFFIAEWVRADFVALELQMMPMVKYGIGSWWVLLWINLSGLAPIRSMAYEFFVFQHLVSAIILLWLLSNHVPSYAMYNVWLAIGFLCFDRAAYGLWIFILNVHRGQHNRPEGSAVYPAVTGALRKLAKYASFLGHPAHIKAWEGEITTVSVKTTHLSWKPGQFMYLWIPRLGPFEFHPYTISNFQGLSQESAPRDIQFAIRAHSGFSRRLLKKARSPQHKKPVTAFIVGPFGSLPTWNAFETVVLIAASTGGSFTLPILESFLRDTGCVRQVWFLLLVSERDHCNCYLSRLSTWSSQVRSLSARVEVNASNEPRCDTQSDGADSPFASCSCKAIRDMGNEKHVKAAPTDMWESRNTRRSLSETASINLDAEHVPLNTDYSSTATPQGCTAPVHFTFGRRDLEEFIRSPIETAYGETLVAVCGGKLVTSDVRNIVAKLSDERAVHKGTGAQGIRLYVEEYGF